LHVHRVAQADIAPDHGAGVELHPLIGGEGAVVARAWRLLAVRVPRVVPLPYQRLCRVFELAGFTLTRQAGASLLASMPSPLLDATRPRMLESIRRLDFMTYSKLTVERFIKSRIRNRASIRKASAWIDAFRKKYGRPTRGFNSVKALRKLRESR
jgi:hypothetical protein